MDIPTADSRRTSLRIQQTKKSWRYMKKRLAQRFTHNFQHTLIVPEYFGTLK